MEAARLRTELSKFSANARVYGATGAGPARAQPSQPLLIFYLDRPVHTIKNLIDEASETEPERVLVANRESIKLLNLGEYAPHDETPFVVVPLPKGEDWPKKLKTVFKPIHDNSNAPED